MTPLRICTPKLIWISENCITDENFLGVLIPNNDSESECILMQNVDDNTVNSQSEHLYILWHLNITVPED